MLHWKGSPVLEPCLWLRIPLKYHQLLEFLSTKLCMHCLNYRPLLFLFLVHLNANPVPAAEQWKCPQLSLPHIRVQISGIKRKELCQA